MRKRNKCGLFLSLCMAVAWTTQAQTSADGYVIAVEGDDVYIDLAEGKIAKGDILEVCSKPGYFVHPVTKKRIRKESKRISSLIVKDVFGDYSTAKSVPSQTLESIQVGMPLKRIEMAVDSSANVGHIVAIDGTDVYIDLTEEEIWPNSKLEVYSKDSYFVHTVPQTANIMISRRETCFFLISIHEFIPRNPSIHISFTPFISIYISPAKFSHTCYMLPFPKQRKLLPVLPNVSAHCRTPDYGICFPVP